MTDIVDRLTREKCDYDTRCYAASEIAILRLEKQKLRAALKECLGWHDYADDMYKPIEVRAAYMRARAALAQGGDNAE